MDLNPPFDVMPTASPTRLVEGLMSPGCVVISEAASVAEAAAAIDRHGIHGVLVVAAETGNPLGWVTVDGLLGWLTRDRSLARVRAAISEPVMAISPSASPEEARRALADTGASRLLVRRDPHVAPEGVLSEMDLIAAGAH